MLPLNRNEKFLTVYLKDNKGAAHTIWHTLCGYPPDQQPTWRDIKRAVLQQKKSERWKQELQTKKKKYIPLASTWLVKRYWLNDPKEMLSFDDRPEFIIDSGRKWDLNYASGKYVDRHGNVYMD